MSGGRTAPSDKLVTDALTPLWASSAPPNLLVAPLERRTWHAGTTRETWLQYD